MTFGFAKFILKELGLCFGPNFFFTHFFLRFWQNLFLFLRFWQKQIIWQNFDFWPFIQNFKTFLLTFLKKFFFFTLLLNLYLANFIWWNFIWRTSFGKTLFDDNLFGVDLRRQSLLWVGQVLHWLCHCNDFLKPEDKHTNTHLLNYIIDINKTLFTVHVNLPCNPILVKTMKLK